MYILESTQHMTSFQCHIKSLAIFELSDFLGCFVPRGNGNTIMKLKQ